MRAGGHCRERVGDDVQDGAGEALVGGVEQTERDGGVIAGQDGPVTGVIADIAAMESVEAVVVVRGNAVVLAVEFEAAIANAVGIAADDGTWLGQ